MALSLRATGPGTTTLHDGQLLTTGTVTFRTPLATTVHYSVDGMHQKMRPTPPIASAERSDNTQSSAIISAWQDTSEGSDEEQQSIHYGSLADGLHLRQLDMISRAHHPNIIPCLRVLTKEDCRNDGIAFILPMTAAILSTCLDQLPRLRLLLVLYRVGLAVQYLHSKGIAHLSLWSGNIYIQDVISFTPMLLIPRTAVYVTATPQVPIENNTHVVADTLAYRILLRDLASCDDSELGRNGTISRMLAARAFDEIRHLLVDPNRLATDGIGIVDHTRRKPARGVIGSELLTVATTTLLQFMGLQRQNGLMDQETFFLAADIYYRVLAITTIPLPPCDDLIVAAAILAQKVLRERSLSEALLMRSVSQPEEVDKLVCSQHYIIAQLHGKLARHKLYRLAISWGRGLPQLQYFLLNNPNAYLSLTRRQFAMFNSLTDNTGSYPA